MFCYKSEKKSEKSNKSLNSQSHDEKFLYEISLRVLKHSVLIHLVCRQFQVRIIIFYTNCQPSIADRVSSLLANSEWVISCKLLLADIYLLLHTLLNKLCQITNKRKRVREFCQIIKIMWLSATMLEMWIILIYKLRIILNSETCK